MTDSKPSKEFEQAYERLTRASIDQVKIALMEHEIGLPANDEELARFIELVVGSVFNHLARGSANAGCAKELLAALLAIDKHSQQVST